MVVKVVMNEDGGGAAKAAGKRGGSGGTLSPWSEKYRPTSLDEVAAHTDIIDTIKKLMNENQLPHMLFYGPPGTGKTSTVLALAKQLYGSSLEAMTLELNASDDRGIDIVRNQVQDFASTRTMMSKTFKLIILDECDAMTKDAQMALRRGGFGGAVWWWLLRTLFTSSYWCDRLFMSYLYCYRAVVMEKYVRNARFCLICNYVNKIIPALQSRCTRFRFQPLPEQFVKTRLEYICKEENLTVDERGLGAVMRLGGGDMRRTLNLLQSTYMSADEVTEQAAYQCAGKPLPDDIQSCMQSLLNDSLKDSYTSACCIECGGTTTSTTIFGVLLLYTLFLACPV